MTSSDRIDHDHLDHRLFSDPRAVAQLLPDFVASADHAGRAPADIDLAEFDLDVPGCRDGAAGAGV